MYPINFVKHPFSIVSLRIVSDDTRAVSAAVTAAPAASTSQQFGVFSVLFFFIFSAMGAFHLPHFDASGFHTCLGVLDGYKVVLVGVPRNSCPKTPPNVQGGDPFVLFNSASEELDVFLYVLKMNEIL